MADGHKDYSGTPLPKKLGFREESRGLLINAPAGFGDLLRPLPPGVDLVSRPSKGLDVIVLFATRQREVDARFSKLAACLEPNGRLWIAWPKKAAKVDTDLTFESVQRVGLDAGLVDNKGASVTDVFQGLQFVYRLEDRARI